MSDFVRNLEDQFSRGGAQIVESDKVTDFIIELFRRLGGY